MKKKRMLMIVAIIQTLFLSACSSSASKQSIKETDKKEDTPVSAVAEAPEEKQIPEDRKEVEIYGTTYIIPKDFLVEEQDDNTTIIYFQNEKPDPVTDAIIIRLLPDVWKGGTEYADSKKCIEELKKERMDGIFDKSTLWADYDKEETAGATISGDANQYYITMYLFMNSYTDAVEITYQHLHDHGTDIQDDLVKEIVDSMHFSYPGFTPEKKEEPSSDKDKFDEAFRNSAKGKKAVQIYEWVQEQLSQSGSESKDDVLKEAAKEFDMNEDIVQSLYDMAEEYVSEGN